MSILGLETDFQEIKADFHDIIGLTYGSFARDHRTIASCDSEII